jgi:hypothetical protein
MFARPFAELRAHRGRSLAGLLVLPMLAVACSEFEPPLRVDARVAPEPTVDTGIAAPKDAGIDAAASGSSDAALHDANVDAQAGAGSDASADAAGAEAAVDAAAPVDAAVPIPKRPVLPKCGFLAPVATGSIMEEGLNEISGIAVSRKNPRVIWVVEDSGNGGQVHAVNDAGRLLATYTIGGAALDMEDLAIGPGPGGANYLYIGDIGDNTGMRPSVAVYRAPEPDVAFDQVAISGPLLMLEPLPFKYPDGSYNAEALIVDPATQDLYIISKDGFTKPNSIYRLAAPHQPATLRTVEWLGATYGGPGTDLAVSAADISADGKRIMVRSLRSATHYTRETGVSILDTILKGTACDAELAMEDKGESISFSATGYFSISEGTKVPLHFVSFQ